MHGSELGARLNCPMTRQPLYVWLCACESTSPGHTSCLEKNLTSYRCGFKPWAIFCLFFGARLALTLLFGARLAPTLLFVVWRPVGARLAHQFFINVSSIFHQSFYQVLLPHQFFINFSSIFCTYFWAVREDGNSRPVGARLAHQFFINVSSIFHQFFIKFCCRFKFSSIFHQFVEPISGLFVKKATQTQEALHQPRRENYSIIGASF